MTSPGGNGGSHIGAGAHYPGGNGGVTSPGTEHDGDQCTHCHKPVEPCGSHNVNQCYIHTDSRMHICSWTSGTDVATPAKKAA